MLDTLRWHPSRAATLDSTWVLLSRDNGVTFPEHLATVRGGDSTLAWMPTGSDGSTAMLRLVYWHAGVLTSCSVSGAFTLCDSGISHVYAANLTGTTASIFWTTTVQNSGAIDYGTGGVPTLTVGEVPEQWRTVHAITLGDLTPRTLYTFRIHGCGTRSATHGLLWQFRTTTDSLADPYVVRGTLAYNDTLHTNYVSVLAWTRRGATVSTPVGLLAPVGATWSLDLGQGRDAITGEPFLPVAGDSVTVSVFEGGSLSGWISADALDGNSPQWVTSAPLLSAAGDPLAATGSGAGGLALHGAWPQPGRVGQPVHFTLAGPLDAGAGVAIYDIRGRCVRRLLPHQAPHPAGVSIEWDTRDDAGHRVPAGVYRVVAHTVHARAVRSLLLLR